MWFRSIVFDGTTMIGRESERVEGNKENNTRISDKTHGTRGKGKLFNKVTKMNRSSGGEMAKL